MSTGRSVQNDAFDPETLRAMGVAFDRACAALRSFGRAGTVQEIIAQEIVDRAKEGERDPGRLCEQSLMALGIGNPEQLLSA